LGIPPTAPTPVLLNGTRRQLPRFPWWIPMVALALIALLIALLALIGRATVPQVVNDPIVPTATQKLVDAGYIVSPIYEADPKVPKDVVIKTEPAGGTALKKGQAVVVHISLGPCEEPCPRAMPDLVGLCRIYTCTGNREPLRVLVRWMGEALSDQPDGSPFEMLAQTVGADDAFTTQLSHALADGVLDQAEAKSLLPKASALVQQAQKTIDALRKRAGRK